MNHPAVFVVVVLLLIAAALAIIVSFFLAIGEYLGVLRFWPWAYRSGICVVRQTRYLPAPTESTESEIQTESGKFKIIAPELVLFRYREDALVFGFAAKGTLLWHGDDATVEVRIPLATNLGLGGWLVGLTMGGTMALLVGERGTENVAWVLLIFAVALATTFISI